MANIKPTTQTINMVPGKDTHSVQTPQWFLSSEYPAATGAMSPLINGERAFAAVTQAIEQAKESIDIMTWGFQPSMYFTRTGKDAKRIGDLLEQAIARQPGIKIRILVWFSELGQLADPNFPGWDPFFPIDDRYDQGGGFRSENDSFEKNKAAVMQGTKRLLSTGKKTGYETDEQYEYDKIWHYRAKNNDFSGLQIRAHDMEWLADSERVKARVGELPAEYNIQVEYALIRSTLLSAFATHHQKVVLVDYASPDDAVGFVMGHNMLSAYWDRDSHKARQSGEIPDAKVGRDGVQAWQDISNCVTGSWLDALNANFVQAWCKDQPGKTLQAERAGIRHGTPTPAQCQKITERLKLEVPLVRAMGQIVRTQPQYQCYDLLTMQMESIRRARNYIYIENQYFRFDALGQLIVKVAKDLHDSGRKEPLHLFVVTNTTGNPLNAVGGYETYKMLDALGRLDGFPNEVRRNKKKETGGVFPAEERNKHDKMEEDPVLPEERPGLKIHICSLVSPDSPANDWQHTYVHSKMMMVDDILLLQGSANINLRSMAIDSEIALAVQDTAQSNIIPQMRNALWGLHTKNFEGCTGNDMQEIFLSWESLLSKNKSAQINDEMPNCSLIKFLDENVNLQRRD